MSKLTEADLSEIEARVVALMKEDQERLDRIRRLLSALPQNASNAQKARAIERIRDITFRPPSPEGARTGRFVRNIRMGEEP